MSEALASQYLQFRVGGQDFLLPSQASIAIEPQAQLLPESGHPFVAAWRAVLSDRWPVFHLEASLAERGRDSWEKAIFVDAKPFPVGLAASQLFLLPKETRIEVFLPPGDAPTTAGPLFSAARVEGKKVTLAFSATALVLYLKGLEKR